MPAMQRTVAEFKALGLPYPVIVGGAPVTADFAVAINADGYAENAPEAVARVGVLVAGGGFGEAEFAA